MDGLRARVIIGLVGAAVISLAARRVRALSLDGAAAATADPRPRDDRGANRGCGQGTVG